MSGDVDFSSPVASSGVDFSHPVTATATADVDFSHPIDSQPVHEITPSPADLAHANAAFPLNPSEVYARSPALENNDYSKPTQWAQGQTPYQQQTMTGNAAKAIAYEPVSQISDIGLRALGGEAEGNPYAKNRPQLDTGAVGLARKATGAIGQGLAMMNPVGLVGLSSAYAAAAYNDARKQGVPVDRAVGEAAVQGATQFFLGKLIGGGGGAMGKTVARAMNIPQFAANVAASTGKMTLFNAGAGLAQNLAHHMSGATPEKWADVIEGSKDAPAMVQNLVFATLGASHEFMAARHESVVQRALETAAKTNTEAARLLNYQESTPAAPTTPAPTAPDQPIQAEPGAAGAVAKPQTEAEQVAALTALQAQQLKDNPAALAPGPGSGEPQEASNAVQEPSSKVVDARPRPGNGGAVGEGNAQGKAAPARQGEQVGTAQAPGAGQVGAKHEEVAAPPPASPDAQPVAPPKESVRGAGEAAGKAERFRIGQVRDNLDQLAHQDPRGSHIAAINQQLESMRGSQYEHAGKEGDLGEAFRLHPDDLKNLSMFDRRRLQKYVNEDEATAQREKFGAQYDRAKEELIRGKTAHFKDTVQSILNDKSGQYSGADKLQAFLHQTWEGLTPAQKAKPVEFIDPAGQPSGTKVRIHGDTFTIEHTDQGTVVKDGITLHDPGKLPIEAGSRDPGKGAPAELGDFNPDEGKPVTTGVFGQPDAATGKKSGALFGENYAPKPEGSGAQQADDAFRAGQTPQDKETTPMFALGAGLVPHNLEEADRISSPPPNDPSVVAHVKALGSHIASLFASDDLPRLLRASAKTANAFAAHASSFARSFTMPRAMLADAFPEHYRTPEGRTKIARMWRALSVDNLRGTAAALQRLMTTDTQRIRDAEQNLAQVKSRGGMSGGTSEADTREQARALKQADQAKRDLVQHTKDAKAASQGAERLLQGWFGGDDTKYHAELNDVELKDMMQKYAKHVEQPLDRMRTGLGEELGARGLETGIHIPMPDATEKNKAHGGPVLEAVRKLGNLMAFNVAKDPLSEHRAGTGQYSDDAEWAIGQAIRFRLSQSTKLDALRTGESEGVLKMVTGDEPGPKGMVFVDKATVPHQNDEGENVRSPVNVYCKPELVSEIRHALNTDMGAQMGPLARAINFVQVATGADFVTHTVNQVRILSQAQGMDSVMREIGRKFPGARTLDSIVQIAQVRNAIAKDSPAIRKEIDWLTSNAMTRHIGSEPGGKEGGHGVRAWVQHQIELNDLAVRISTSRMYEHLAKIDPTLNTVEGRRRWVNQLGQYNSRLQGNLTRLAKGYGISPFVVAGRAMTKAGIRAVTGSPGIKVADPALAVKMRALNMLGGTVGAAAMAASFNYLRTGRLVPPAGVPITAIALGKQDDNGNERYIDLDPWVGRGLGALGGKALQRAMNPSNSMQRGMRGRSENASQMMYDAAIDIAGAQARPWMGPFLTAGWMAATGKTEPLVAGQAPGMQVVPQHGTMTTLKNNVVQAMRQTSPYIPAAIKSVEGHVGYPTPETRDSPYLGTLIGQTLSRPWGVEVPTLPKSEDEEATPKNHQFGPRIPKPR